MQFNVNSGETVVSHLQTADKEYAPFRRESLLRRSVSKRGYCALQEKKSEPRYYVKYVKDPFTTLIDCRWRSLILIYTLSFLVTWLIFAVLWWIIAYVHGDTKDSPYKNDGIMPCVTYMDDFLTSFIFSMETQVTIGYGTRTPTTECPDAIALLSIQSIFGLLLQSIVVGIVFAKLSRPKTRGESVLFSKKAVISTRDDQPYLMFRIGDERKSHLTGCKLRGWLIETKKTNEGLLLPNYATKLNMSVDDGGSRFFLLWPVIATHKIDQSSPLYGLHPEQMAKTEMEIVISLVCTSEATGQEIEIRCSYTHEDILWGHLFKSVMQKNTSDLVVDYENFDDTVEVNAMGKIESNNIANPVAHSSNSKS